MFGIGKSQGQQEEEQTLSSQLQERLASLKEQRALLQAREAELKSPASLDTADALGWVRQQGDNATELLAIQRAAPVLEREISRLEAEIQEEKEADRQRRLMAARQKWYEQLKLFSSQAEQLLQDTIPILEAERQVAKLGGIPLSGAGELATMLDQKLRRWDKLLSPQTAQDMRAQQLASLRADVERAKQLLAEALAIDGSFSAQVRSDKEKLIESRERAVLMAESRLKAYQTGKRVTAEEIESEEQKLERERMLRERYGSDIIIMPSFEEIEAGLKEQAELAGIDKRLEAAKDQQWLADKEAKKQAEEAKAKAAGAKAKPVAKPPAKKW